MDPSERRDTCDHFFGDWLKKACPSTTLHRFETWEERGMYRAPLPMPCRWAWQYAHGKAYIGRAFPVRRCPQCSHIRRAGEPMESVSEAG